MKLRLAHACSITQYSLFCAFVRIVREEADALRLFQGEVEKLFGRWDTAMNGSGPNTGIIRDMVTAANSCNGKHIGFESLGEPGWSITWTCDDGTFIRLTWNGVDRHALSIDTSNPANAIMRIATISIDRWDAGIVLGGLPNMLNVQLRATDAAIAALSTLLR